ncbi:hypothetical protein MMC17_006747 [Xylographa soralifera]|nr:hypothetical protein [Xylographa soralifera]
MAYKFTHSCVVIGKLARDAARTPPPDGEPFEFIDRSLTILGRTFDTYDERMRQEFLGQREFIASQSRGVDLRFEEIENKMNRRFDEVDKRFDEVDKKFKALEQKMDRRFEEVDKKMDRRFEEVDKKMRQRFDHIQKASRNFLRTRGWEEIYPVGSFDSQGSILTPQYFPRTVKRFWKLKGPSQSKQSENDIIQSLGLTRSIVHRLIYLTRFYNIQGYEEWGMDVESHEGCSDSDESTEGSSKSSRLPVPVEVAVRSNPEIAHRALAAQLGLVYDEIQKFMERAHEFGNTQPQEENKRRQDNQTSADRKRRAFKRSPEDEGTELTSPVDHPSSQDRTS